MSEQRVRTRFDEYTCCRHRAIRENLSRTFRVRDWEKESTDETSIERRLIRLYAYFFLYLVTRTLRTQKLNLCDDSDPVEL